MSETPVLLVTGGSRGIGAAVSLMAASRGWRVAVNYASNREAADKVVSDIEAATRAGVRGLLFPGGNLSAFLREQPDFAAIDL